MTPFGFVGGPADIVSNYRAINFVVASDSPCNPLLPMYLDIYTNIGSGFVYYKTVTSYTIFYANGSGGYPGTNALYEFDIQDALQEFLQTYTANLLQIPNPNTIVNTANDPSFVQPPYSYCSCKVYARGSSISGGVLIPEGPVPIQGTAISDPTSGGGLLGDVFTVVNSSIPSLFSTIFANDLQALMTSNLATGGAISVLPDTEIYSLSNLQPIQIDISGDISSDLGNALDVYLNDGGSCPIYINCWGTSGILNKFYRNCHVDIRVFWGLGTIFLGSITSTQLIGIGTFFLPKGLLDILYLQPALNTYLLDSTNSGNIYYNLTLVDDDANRDAYYSPLYKVCLSGIQTTCLWFQNMYGQFEQVSFVRYDEVFKTSSSEQFIPYGGSQFELVDSEEFSTPDALGVGKKRYNVRANDEITLTALFNEQLMPWIKELMSSPYVVQQIPSVGGSGNFRAVKIVDGSFSTKLEITKAGTKYRVSIKVIPSVESIIQLRN